MTTQTLTRSGTPVEQVGKDPDRDLVVIARDPSELVEAQHDLIARLERKRDDAAFSERELSRTIEEAEGSRINVQPLKNQRMRAANRVAYYEKLIEALRAGYVIVPDLPAQTVAVRVNREKPRRKRHRHSFRRIAESDASSVTAQQLPPGEGRYVTGADIATEEEADAEGRTKYTSFPVAFQDELDLPAEFLKPRIIERTREAMDLRIFDELSIVTGRADPIVVGRILRPGNVWDAVAFVVAWFVDTADL